MANKSFGKNLLKVSCMLIAALMLISTAIIGSAPATVNAEGETETYVISVAPNTSGMPTFGQWVTLEKGKTYVFTVDCLYGSTLNWRIFYDHSQYDTVDYNETDLTGDEVYENTWPKLGVKFTVPENTPENVPEAEDGKVKMWVGLRAYNLDTTLYYYNFKLYDVTAPEANLFKDCDLLEIVKSGTILKSDVWKSVWGAINKNFAKVTLEAAGGENVFKLPTKVLAIAPNTKGGPFFGQWVTLEKGKTYIYSNCRLNGTNKGCAIYFDHTVADTDYYEKDYDSTELTVEEVYDNEWSLQGVKFTVPEDAPGDENGKAKIWVGLRGYYVDKTLYYYNFKLYDVNAPEANLLQDCALLQNGTDLDKSVWKSPWNTSIKDALSKVTLEAAGGMDTFKKTDAERHVLKLAPNSKGMPFFGQRVLLEPGKTYVFSNYFLSGTDANQLACYPGMQDTPLDGEITTDKKYSKQSLKFTVPTDAETDEDGKVLVFVGFRGNYDSEPLYYYDLTLYDVSASGVNLFKDSAFEEADFEVKSDTWKTPGGGYVNTDASLKWTEISLESIGGISAFLPFEVKCDCNLDGVVDIRDLIRMKKYSVGTIDTLPEGTGNLNYDAVIGGAADLILLRKELLK